jgi:sterol desaturase/sphingolipid hydroxylase (fatty acid hydroxylase superfamily)
MKKLVLTLLSILIILCALAALAFLNISNGWSAGWGIIAVLSITILPYYAGFLLLLAGIWVIAYVLKHV